MIKRRKISPKIYNLMFDDGTVETIHVKDNRDYSAVELLAMVNEVRNPPPTAPIKSVADELKNIKIRLDKLELDQLKKLT